LHLETAEISANITGKEVSNIQLNGRNFTQLIALTPGVSNQTPQDEARVGMAGSVSYSVNGGRAEYNSFQVDGAETLNVGINKNHSTLIVYPSIDAIQEIKVLTSNYGAMYPSTGNGTTIVTTKSGTDTYHGGVYEFFRNEALNAKGYFDTGNSAPLYRRNDFGGTIGGPLSIRARLSGAFTPSFLNEFVASYTNSYITLNDLAAPGVSIAQPAILDQPCSGQSTDCGMTTIFPRTTKMPGISIAGNNPVYGGLGFAVDPGYMPWEHSNPTYTFTDNLNKTFKKHNCQFGADWVIFQRNQTNGPIGAATGDTQGLLTFSNVCVQGSTGNAFADYLYSQTTDSTPPGGSGAISSFQQDSAQDRYRQRYQIFEPYFQGDFKVAPRLTTNLGIRVSIFGSYYEANHIAYNWQQSALSQTAAQGVTVDGQGGLRNTSDGTPIPIYTTSGAVNPVILNGIVQCGKNGVPASCMSDHKFNPAPRVGFAWDPTGTGKTALRGGYGIFFEHGTAGEANTGSLEGSAPIVRSMSVEHELPGNTLASVAYVGSKGTHLTAESESNQLTPLSGSDNPFAPHQPLFTRGANPAVLGGSSSGDCSAIPAGTFYLTNGTTLNYGDPGYSNMVAACYASIGSVNFFGQNTANSLSPNALRTYAPGIGEIFALENVANSSYNALQATMRKVQGPITLSVAYTYSHSLDNASDRSDSTCVNSFDLKSNRASSSFDQRHLLHISYIYELPLIRAFDNFLHFAVDDPSNMASHDTNGVRTSANWAQLKSVKAVLGGWQLSGVTLFETGIPFTVVNNGSPTGVGTLDNAGVANGVGSGSYPDLSGISAYSKKPLGGNNSKSFGPLLLNPAAFVAPRGLTFGTAGRNSLNNPKRWNWDMALQKNLPVFERANVEFRAEAFNIFNNTQFRIYDPTLGTQAQNEVSCYGGNAAYYSAAGGDGLDCLTGSSFLHPVDAHRPRTMQLALKVTF
jgi:TonB-dependent Receptor Plug Domain